MARRLFALALAALLLSVGVVARPAQAAVTLTLGGPDAITQSGNYTYSAYFGAPYPQFLWYKRTCATATVASCTATWTQVTSGIDNSQVYRSNYTTYLTRDCTGGGTRSFQVKVVASGFGQPAQTKYKATRLCGEVLP